jgi:chemotaxis protein histidine kinase CheA
MLDLMSKDPTSLVQFINNTEQALAQINERMRNNDDTSQGRLHTIAYIMRVVHGIKGEASALKLNMFENYAHDFEQELTVMRDRGEVRGSDIVRITVLLDGFYDRLSSISIVAKRAQGDGNTRAPETEPSVLLAEHFNNLIERVTQNAGKRAKALIDVSAVDTLPRRIVNELQQIGIQLIRNAVKHGIETPDERIAAGKQPVGEIRIACKDIGRGHYAFSVRDDGHGISVEKIRRQLVASGAMSEADVSAMSPRDVIMTIFKSGFSTSPEADRDAGRGVGLDVVTDKVVQMHGNLTLNSKTGVYTEFRIAFEV